MVALSLSLFSCRRISMEVDFSWGVLKCTQAYSRDEKYNVKAKALSLASGFDSVVEMFVTATPEDRMYLGGLRDRYVGPDIRSPLRNSSPRPIFSQLILNLYHAEWPSGNYEDPIMISSTPNVYLRSMVSSELVICGLKPSHFLLIVCILRRYLLQMVS